MDITKNMDCSDLRKLSKMNSTRTKNYKVLEKIIKELLKGVWKTKHFPHVHKMIFSMKKKRKQIAKKN